jgi:hypothetical protein
MRRIKWCTFIFLLFVTAVSLAQSSPSAKGKGRKTARPQAASQQDIRELRDLVSAQQSQLEQQHREMEQLRSQLQLLIDANQQTIAAAQKLQTSAEQAQSTAAQAQQSAAEAQRLADQVTANAVAAKTALSLVNNRSQDEVKRVVSLENVLGRFRLQGDIRLRGESFFQGCTLCDQRNRARIRVRFGVESQLNQDFIAGAALATGPLGDPTTTNESLANFFDRKTIALDQGFVSYRPVAHSWLQITGGKFPYTWNRTSVTGDPDINPEGFNQKLSWDLQIPVLKNFTVQGMQLLYNEVASGTDSYSLGGQVAARLQVGRWSAEPSFMALKWNNPGAILQASAFAVGATTTTGGLPVPGQGPGCAKGQGLPSTAPCALSPNGMTNATYLDPSGRPQFHSGFLYADFILANQFKTGLTRLPVNLLLEYEQNLDAASHPFDSTGKVIPGLGSQGKTYMTDLSLGQLKNRNDVQFGYAWLRQEQDAVIASFAESEQRAPTNILQNRFYGLWKLRSNTVASYTFWYGRTLNSALQHAVLAPGTAVGTVEPHLKRMQFDLIYTF